MLTSLLAFVVVIAILVTVHEYGHFWVARRLGVKVLRFSIGFGRTLWSRRARDGETEYVIAAIPLGGYVKMLDEREGPVDASELDRAFNRQPLRVRIAVVLAGPLSNFVLAIVAYTLVFMIGVTGLKPIVGEVTPGSLADRGGFASGDLIERVDGHPVATWNEAFLSIIDASLKTEVVTIDVLDAEHRPRVRRIDFASVQGKVDRDNLMNYIGIAPYRIVIPPVIGGLEDGGAASRAGLRIGDRIVSADGEPIEDWGQWVEYVRARPGKTIDLVVVGQDGRHRELSLTPAPLETSGGTVIGRIGAAVDYPEEDLAAMQTTVRHGPVGALSAAIGKTWSMTLLTFRMLANMVTGNVSVDNLSGPISIAQFAGQSANLGAASFIGFIALISISLGVLNLLPVPVLDGGHLLFYLIEGVQGRPLSMQAEAIGQRIGLAFILGLMVIAFYNDIARLFG